VRLLLSLGADVNVIAGVYGSALSAAIVSEERSAGEVVDILLEAGANVNAIGCQQYGTPLTAAVCLERKAIAYKLLRRGANPNLIVPERINAVEHAVAIAGHTGDEELLDMLLEYEADINIFHEVSFDYDSTPLQSVCGYGNKMLVRKLILKHKANICIGRECRRLGRSHQVSALVRACVNGHIDVAQILIGFGADVNVRGGCYGTPLQATIAMYAPPFCT